MDGAGPRVPVPGWDERRRPRDGVGGACKGLSKGNKMGFFVFFLKMIVEARTSKEQNSNENV